MHFELLTFIALIDALNTMALVATLFDLFGAGSASPLLTLSSQYAPSSDNKNDGKSSATCTTTTTPTTTTTTAAAALRGSTCTTALRMSPPRLSVKMHGVAGPTALGAGVKMRDQKEEESREAGGKVGGGGEDARPTSRNGGGYQCAVM